MVLNLIILLVFLSTAQAFIAMPSISSCDGRRKISNVAAKRNNNNEVDEEFMKSLKEVGKGEQDPSRKFFTGGAFEDKIVDKQAAQLASRITSVRQLGWTSSPPKRRGAARPRHRAYGGQTEKPIQLKPGYDELSPQCVEKWLTQEIFYEKVKDSSPAADAVFCALAGGAAFCERTVVESRLEEWRRNDKGKFQEAAFYRSLKQGRFELATGWILFGSANALLLLCVVVPTNPVAKFVETILQQILQGYAAL